MAAKRNICIVGTGYVGLVTGACFAKLGHTVLCVDSDRAKIAALSAKKIPIYEHGLDEIVFRNMRAGRLFFSDLIPSRLNFKKTRFDVVFIAVGTPPRPDGSADLSSVESVTQTVARNMTGYTLIVEKSTVPVETGEWLKETVERFKKPGIPYDVASNPEFLREGSAVRDFLHPDRIVIGVSSKRAEGILRQIYEGINAPMIVTDIKSAELIKHASNSFLATKISFINAIANLCEKTGADVTQIAKGMGMDKRIGPSFLNAGTGYGGFCFPKDVEAFYWISKKKGYDFKLLQTVKEINESQKKWVAKKVEEEMRNLEGKCAGILGLAFKPNTDDIRYAPSVDIIKGLLAKGMKVQACDPVAVPKAKKLLPGVRFVKDAYACAKGADCLILATEWEEFKGLNFRRILNSMRHPVIIDGRNLYDPKALRKMGFTYRGVGRP